MLLLATIPYMRLKKTYSGKAAKNTQAILFQDLLKVKLSNLDSSLMISKLISMSLLPKTTIESSSPLFSSLFISVSKAEVFYNVKKRSSFITSKSLPKNLSNENKHWSFCCLQDRAWIKVPILWKHRVYLFSSLRFFDKLFVIIKDDPFLTL